MTDRLTVNLGARSYPIQFGPDLSASVCAQVAALAAEGRRVAVVTDNNVISLKQLEGLRAMFGAASWLPVPSGEASKSVKGLETVLDFLAFEQFGRSDALFAFGGGVIGDLAGFAAASYLRGIAFYQVPTTLLAMVDSSVGGKTGINLKAGKNLVGAFHQPRGVFISTNLLATLPPREFAAGCAEIIKAGLLGDPELFARLERPPLTGTSSDLAAVIRRCCALKARVVEADEFETAKEGGRALLNLGHTFGHAIEQATGYGAYLHGEAVAIGLCAAARLSQKLGLIAAGDVLSVEKVVEAHALLTRLRAPLPLAMLMAAMARDKKVRAGRLRFVVLKSLGEAVTCDDVDPALAEACFREVGAA
ncbi:MAG: 3-dehydroquinate synthase [Verrucomicrobiota bacterium]